MMTTVLGAFPTRSAGQDPALPVQLGDRGTGQPTSMCGTYIPNGELIDSVREPRKN